MIEVEDLRKIYRIGFWRKSVSALSGISFDVNAGELYGFIGPNGAGKSTTIKILLGLLRADSGHATLMGQKVGTPGSRAQVGFLPEQPYFYDYLSGQEFLNFYGRLSGLGWRSLKNRIEEVREMVQLRPDVLNRTLRTYSKGMLQRIGLAQALLSKPKLVILDEPMSGLDPLGRRDVRNILKRLHSEGITVFYSTHVLSDVEAICTKLAMVVDGQIRRSGTVAEVLAGEPETTQVTLKQELDLNTWPQNLGTPRVGRILTCHSAQQQKEVLSWVTSQGLEIETITRQRNSLEDVLAKEVAKVL